MNIIDCWNRYKEDEDVEEELFKLVYQFCYNQAKRFVKNEDDAHDISMQVITKLWEMVKEENPPEKILGWLRTVVKHRSINLIQKNQRMKISDIELLFGEFLHLKDESMKEAHDIEEFLKKIKGILNPKQYRIFILRGEGYNNHEIAEKLNLTYQTVSNQISKIRNKLKKLN